MSVLGPGKQLVKLSDDSKVQLSGSSGEQEYSALTTADMPDATEVPSRSTCFVLEDGDLYYTDGTEWKLVGGGA